MSESNSISTPDMTGWTRILYVIDGEIADIELLQPGRERRIAVITSNPQIVVWDETTTIPYIGMPWAQE